MPAGSLKKKEKQKPKKTRRGTMYSGIFLVYVWVDSVAPREGTIGSREQFKLIRSGENLAMRLVDYRSLKTKASSVIIV